MNTDGVDKRKPIDAFFERLEQDPLYLAPNGNCLNRLAVRSDLQEAVRKMRVVEKLKRDILRNLDQVNDVIVEVMEDPSFETLGDELMSILNHSRKEMQEVLDRKLEDIECLTYGRPPWIE